MCYTAQDSLTAYIINIISATLLYFYTDNTDFKILSLFLLFVGQMQILDYLFWINLECNQDNKMITKIAIIFNHLQPIVLFLLLNYFNYQQNTMAIISIILYTFFMVRYTIKIWPKDDCTITSSVCCSLPHDPNDEEKVINWQWNHQPNNSLVYFLFLAYLTFASFSFKSNKYLFALINLGSFFISTKIPKLNQSIGRIWCYLAAFVPAFLLLYSQNN
jgi:hypothetical protein